MIIPVTASVPAAEELLKAKRLTKKALAEKKDEPSQSLKKPEWKPLRY